jgi:DNA-binding transcriptional MerR regulator/methylmalonyl-CoA mutase cobalamin-binding subunit
MLNTRDLQENAMHTIQAVADRTGLTPDVIRVWERRYQAVAPQRSASNQRMYSDDDIERLALLRQLTDTGLRISNIANLGTSDLRDLYQKEHEKYGRTPLTAGSKERLQGRIDACMKAIIDMDPVTLERELQVAVVEMGTVSFLSRLIHPLLVKIGEDWRAGNLRTSQEHFSSAALRSFLGRYFVSGNMDNRGPVIIMGTPTGHSHEMGAAMASMVAAQAGWNVVYLGPSIPVEELAWTAEQKKAAAVALSIHYPPDDPTIPPYLEELKELLPSGVDILIGGSSAPYYQAVAEKIGGYLLDDLCSFSPLLDELRRTRRN